MGEVNQDAINDAIAKFAGEDSAYADKLKGHVANYVGYSNQVASMPKVDDPEAVAKMGGGVDQSYLRGNITPGGVTALGGAGVGLLNKETSALQSLAKGAKSNATKKGGEAYEGLAGFEANDSLDNAIQRWMKNPKNEEGNYKSLDELQKELEGAVLGGDAQWNEEDVSARLAQRVPEGARETLQEDFYKSIGNTQTEAENLIKLDRYTTGQMPEYESDLYKITDPGFAAKADIMKDSPGLQAELTKLQSDSPEALPYTDLVEKFPSITPEIAKPYYKQAAASDVPAMIEERAIPVINENGKAVVPEAFLGESKDVAKLLGLEYKGILSAQEIEDLIYQYWKEKSKGFPIDFDAAI